MAMRAFICMAIVSLSPIAVHAQAGRATAPNAPPLRTTAAGATLLPAPLLAPEPPVSARAPYAPDALSPATAVAPAQPSVVLDKARGQALLDAQQPRPLTTIDVVGSTDKPVVAPKSLQQRFSDTLTAPPYLHSWTYQNSTEPCTSLASPGTPFSPAFNVYGFCP